MGHRDLSVRLCNVRVIVSCVSGHSPVDIRGGRLEIAGVVVGSWGGRKGHLLDRYAVLLPTSLISPVICYHLLCVCHYRVLTGL